MKTVGIVTFWDSEDNYGQVLQCFALNWFLRKNGYDAFLIRNDNTINRTFFQKIFNWIRLFLSPSKFMSAVSFKMNVKKQAMQNAKHLRNFESFRKKNIPSTRFYSQFELCNNPPLFDAYICGSDQIWSGLSAVHYLQFVPNSRKKIAYAASMGGYKPNEKERIVLKRFVKNFNYVSLREKQALDFFKKYDICQAEYVPDPTFLLTRNEYKKLYENKDPFSRKPYILLYLLGNKLQFNVSEIYEYAKKRMLDVVYVASQGRTDGFPKEYPSIEEWLELVENADVVVTNSFHGTVFSMLYRKKFVTLLLTGAFAKMNDRITDMLSKYSLENRIYSGKLEDFDNDVDYTFFESVVSKEREYVRKKIIDVIG